MGARRIRVLLAEDEPKLSFAVQTLLEMEEMLDVVSVVSSADAAIEAAVEIQPDVVLIDVRLGDGDGIAAATAICAALREVAIVVYSGDEGELARARDEGFEHLLMKGAITTDLVAAIATAAGRRSPGPVFGNET